MKLIVTISFLLLSVLTFGQKNKGKSYSEDLRKVHPTYEFNADSLLIEDTASALNTKFETKNDENKRLDAVLDTLFEINKNIKYIRGYRILVYSGGTEGGALEVRKAILDIFDKENNEFKGTDVEFIYHQPMFRIMVGAYTSRLEAVRMAEYLKKQKFDFGEESEITVNPLVVPDNIEIKR